MKLHWLRHGLMIIATIGAGYFISGLWLAAVITWQGGIIGPAGVNELVWTWAAYWIFCTILIDNGRV